MADARHRIALGLLTISGVTLGWQSVARAAYLPGPSPTCQIGSSNANLKSGEQATISITNWQDTDYWVDGESQSNVPDNMGTIDWSIVTGPGTLSGSGSSVTLTAGCPDDDATITVQAVVHDSGTHTGAVESVTRTIQVTVTATRVDRIQRNNAGTWTDITGTLTVAKGTTVSFKALPAPAGSAWPSGKPTWGGDASGTGETTNVTFNTTGNRTVTATCGNTVTVNVYVNGPPVFADDAEDILYELDEDVAVNTAMFTEDQELGELYATDPDGDTVQYSCSQSDYFAVNPTTGVISIVDPAGLAEYFETADTISLQVYASDGINPSIIGQFVLGKSWGVFDQSYIDLTDSASTHYTPTTAAQLIANLNTIQTNGRTVSLLIIKNHGSSDGIKVGTGDDWLTVENGDVTIGDTDVTQLLTNITGNSSVIKLRGCHSLPLAGRLQNALNNGTTAYGARGFVIGIPGTPWGIGWYQ